MGQQYGDTTLTKVFVGGLAWETQKDVLKEHFDQYGEILEAVIISDKVTGYSKGYGFVTFKEAESAKKACDDATPMINGRRANCNLAALGARKSRSSPPAQPQQQQPPPATVMRARGPPPATWYYHAQGAPQPPASAVHHHYPGMIPYYAAAAAAYGYSPPYMASLGYTAAKVSHAGAGGSYVQGHYTYPAQGGIVAPSEMLPLYPVYHYHHHQSQNMGGMPAAAHFFNPSTAAIPAAAIISKPTVIPPAAVHLAMEQVTGCS